MLNWFKRKVKTNKTSDMDVGSPTHIDSKKGSSDTGSLHPAGRLSKLLLSGKTAWAVSLLLVTTIIGTLGINIQDKSSVPSNQTAISVGEKVITIGDTAQAAGAVDYTFDGVNDNVEFQLALNALPATGGRLVIVSATTINFDVAMAATGVTRAIDNVVIEGSGSGTYFVRNGAALLFTAGGNNWKFTNLRTDAGGIDMGATTGWSWRDVTIGAVFYANSGTFSAPGTPDYVVGVNTATDDVPGTGYWVKSGATGQVVETNAAADVSINWAITNLTAGRLHKEIIKLVGSITLTNQIVLDNYMVLDMTDARLILANGAAITNMIYGTGKHDFEIVGGILNGNRDGITWGADSNYFNGIRLVTCTDFVIRGITFDDMRSDDVRLQTTCTRGLITDCEGFNTSANQNYDHVAITGSSYITVEDCYFTKKSCGVYVGPGSDYNIIKNNRIYSTYDGEHIYVYQSSFNLIEGNTCIGKQTHTGECISISSADNRVIGNYCDPQVMCTGIGAGTDGGEFATGTIISNNRVINAENEGISVTQINCTISNNIVTASSRWGICVSAMATVTGNVVTASDYANIRVQTGSDGSTITGNTVTYSGDTGGIQIVSNYNTVSENNAYANVGAGIAGSGNNNIISGNTLIDNNGSGIYLPSGNYNQIIGNTVTRVSASQNYGIAINSGTGNTISNNVVFNQSDQNIRIANGVTLTTIDNNDLRGTGTAILLLDTGGTTVIRNNKGYIAPGEVRTYSGTIATLTENAFNSVDNPFGQTVRVLSEDYYVSTGATATSPNIDCGIGASATTDYNNLTDDLPGETIGFYKSTIATPGTQTVPILWQSGAGNRYLNHSIKGAAATGMVMTYTITVMGN